MAKVRKKKLTLGKVLLAPITLPFKMAAAPITIPLKILSSPAVIGFTVGLAHGLFKDKKRRR